MQCQYVDSDVAACFGASIRAEMPGEVDRGNPDYGVRNSLSFLSVNRSQTRADGVLSQLGHTVQIELGHNLAAVGFDGLDADV